VRKGGEKGKISGVLAWGGGIQSETLYRDEENSRKLSGQTNLSQGGVKANEGGQVVQRVLTSMRQQGVVSPTKGGVENPGNFLGGSYTWDKGEMQKNDYILASEGG